MESRLPDPLHNASSAGHLCGCWRWTRYRRRLGPGTWAQPRRDRRPRGKGTNFGLEGRRLGLGHRWGLDPGREAPRAAPQYIPDAGGRAESKAAVLRIQCPQGTSYAPYCSRLGWAPWRASSGLIRGELLTGCGALTGRPRPPPGYYCCPSWGSSRQGLKGCTFPLRRTGVSLIGHP